MKNCRQHLATLAMSALMVLGLANPALAQSQSSESASVDAQSGEPSTSPTEVDAETLGIDPEGATVPWRAERLADGSVELTFGGIERVPLEPDAVDVVTGTPETAQANTQASTQAAWACDVNEGQYSTVREGNNLRSAYEVTCDGVASHRVDWQFQRSSYRGYLGYTDIAVGGFISDRLNAQTVYAFCPSGTPGTYQYRLQSTSVVNVDGQTLTSPAFSSQISSAQGCGTGIS